MSHTSRLLVFLSITLLINACTRPEEPDAAPVADMPPGFLDEPPPGPVSATTVLSGATLVTTQTVPDAVVVVQNGRLLSSGKRGEADMPNDSVGLDMRGRWLVPGRPTDLTADLPNLTLWQVGEPLNLLILKRHPGEGNLSDADLAGLVVDGEIQLFEEE